jgi:hypothetical protein
MQVRRTFDLSSPSPGLGNSGRRTFFPEDTINGAADAGQQLFALGLTTVIVEAHGAGNDIVLRGFRPIMAESEFRTPSG